MNKLYQEAAIVRKAIQRYGGSFISRIGDAMDCADVINLRKIKATWPKEWNQYLEMGRMAEKDHAESKVTDYPGACGCEDYPCCGHGR